MTHFRLILQIPETGVDGLFRKRGKCHRRNELRAAISKDAAHGHTGLANQADEFAGLISRNAAANDEKNALRSEEHTSELQSLMRISYAVFCLKNTNKQK